MPNTMTALVRTLFSSAKEVAQEPIGVLSSINMSWDNKRVAKGDTVKVPVAPSRSIESFTPAATSSSGADATATSVSVTLANFNKVTWHLTGEESRSLDNGISESRSDWLKQMFAQGMRTLRNDAESKAAIALYKGGSRALGTAGTTPFGSSVDILADAVKVLRDNGAPLTDTYGVFNTSAINNMQKLDIFQHADKAGNTNRETGVLGRQFGISLKDSAQIASHTAGTGSGYLVDVATTGWAIGTTTAHVDTGTGTILAGDVITHASDSTNKYVVNTGFAGDGDGDIVLGNPGIVGTAAGDDDAVTIGAAYTANMVFERSAMVGIARPPEGPWPEGTTEILVTDPATGMTFLFLDIKQYGQRTWELHLAYDFKVINSEYVVVVMG